MSISDRREAVLELTANGHSTRDIGEVLGVSHTTAERDIGTNVPVDDTARREREEAATEENKRETLLRLSEAAYRGTAYT